MWFTKSVEVKTPLGPIKGAKIDSCYGVPIYTFQGIPYAKPPVGGLRFKDPVAVEPWTKMLDCTKPPPKAPSMNIAELKMELLPDSSEDCLYVNVYTPQVPNNNQKLPVMAWIHGGGFTFGTGNRDSYGPDYIVPNGVILVSISYRIGAFGFLSLQTEECPGNYGLKDQSLALKWIQNNIAAFGGDPGNVTLFGESAGAASVQYQMLSPLSRGLFHKAIAQSGSALCRWAYSRQPEQSALLLAKRLGCDTKDPAEALRAIRGSSTKDVVFKSDGIYGEIGGTWAGESLLAFSFAPTAEPVGTPNAFLTKTVEQALADGDMADVPFIHGVNSCEMSFVMLSHNYVPLFTQDEEYQYMLPKEREVPLNSEKSIAAAKKLREFYFPNGNTQEGYLKAQTSVWFTYPAYKTLMTDLKTKKTPDYFYVFDECRYPSGLRSMFGTQDIPGAGHADDLEFLFHPVTVSRDTKPPIERSSKDGKISALLTKLWTDFAKTGVPSTDWPPAKPDNLSYAHIKDNLVVKTDYAKDEMQFWEELHEFMKSA